MPFVLTGNLETDTLCRFGMAEIQQGGGARASRFDPEMCTVSGVYRPLRPGQPAV
jgi:hypothetical protein